MEATLVLIRHGESEWNARNVWTGLTDIGLSDKGRKEASASALQLRDIPFSVAFTSGLKRAAETLSIILTSLGKSETPVTHATPLNERDYGIYTGKNKLEIKEQMGEVEFLKLRRGWDYPIPEGESLKKVYERVVPYFETHIKPLLEKGISVLVVAHGNSLRALMKYIEHISDEHISDVELATGEIVMYRIDASGALVAKEKRTAG